MKLSLLAVTSLFLSAGFIPAQELNFRLTGAEPPLPKLLLEPTKPAVKDEVPEFYLEAKPYILKNDFKIVYILNGTIEQSRLSKYSPIFKLRPNEIIGFTKGLVKCEFTDGTKTWARQSVVEEEAAVPTRTLVVVGTTWCPACRQLESTWTAQGIPYAKVDGDRDRSYSVTAYPTIIVLENGVEVSRHVGYADGNSLLRK